MTAKQARHVVHGYAVESGRRVSAERFIVTGDVAEAKPKERSCSGARPTHPHDGPAVQQQKAPQHEQAQKPPQRKIQRGYGIGVSL